MEATVLEGDARARLRELPDESVHVCVTSPPYWWLRDYAVEGQLGLEPTFEAYLANLVGVFREVKRVLRPDATLWVNMGDSYAGGGGGPQGKTGQRATRTFTASGLPGKRVTGLKDKDLIGQPWALAFALRADGWWLRSDIVWEKANPTPESMEDRPTRAHEYVFLLSKSARYYYDADAIREAPLPENAASAAAIRASHGGWGDLVRANASTTAERNVTHPAGRNKRTVWEIATQPRPWAHFATFPDKLVEPCILAGSSESGCCPTCAAPWRRVRVETKSWREEAETRPQAYARLKDSLRSSNGGLSRSEYETTGWEPTCKHPHALDETVPCTVLDPFAGTGTTGAVALAQGRRALLIEISPRYVTFIRRRLARVQLPLRETRR